MSIDRDNIERVRSVEAKLDSIDQERLSKVQPVIQRMNAVGDLLLKRIGTKLDTSPKPPLQVRMDIIKAVSLHSQLVYDLEFRLNDEDEVVPLFHTFLPTLELYEQKNSLLDGESRTTNEVRMKRKMAEKYLELRKPARDFNHLLDNWEKYEGAEPRGVYSDCTEPEEILELVESVDLTDWSDLIFSLRAVVIGRNCDVLHEIETAWDETDPTVQEVMLERSGMIKSQVEPLFHKAVA
jgi:hypothetical protein